MAIAVREASRATLAGEIVIAYVRTRRAMRSAPFVRVLESVRHCGSYARDGAGQSSLAEARRLGHAVARTLALLPGDTRCLARSLVLIRLLSTRGIQAKLVIGTRTGSPFLAHAWVEHAGQPVLCPGDGSFGRLVEL